MMEKAIDATAKKLREEFRAGLKERLADANVPNEGKERVLLHVAFRIVEQSSSSIARLQAACLQLSVLAEEPLVPLAARTTAATSLAKIRESLRALADDKPLADVVAERKARN